MIVKDHVLLVLDKNEVVEVQGSTPEVVSAITLGVGLSQADHILRELHFLPAVEMNSGHRPALLVFYNGQDGTYFPGRLYYRNS